MYVYAHVYVYVYVFAYLCHIFNRRWRPLAPSPRMSNEQRDTGGGKGELPGTPGNSRAFGIIGTANSRELPGELPGVPKNPRRTPGLEIQSLDGGGALGSHRERLQGLERFGKTFTCLFCASNA